MKIIEIANKIDKSKKNEEFVETDQFSDEFGYEFDWVEQDRLKSYWIGNWYCTDSYVGFKMYFLNDVPVAVSSQSGRKSEEKFEWFSEELALRVRDYLISIMPQRKLNFKLCNINEDVGDSYKIQFNSQILNPENVMFNGQPVKILERIKNTPDYGIDTMLRIKLFDGEEKIVNIRELDFKYHLL